jgi:hypothetical protein
VSAQSGLTFFGLQRHRLDQEECHEFSVEACGSCDRCSESRRSGAVRHGESAGLRGCGARPHRTAADQVRNADGQVVFDARRFDFIHQREGALYTVNPSLWRQAQLITKAGLFKVIERFGLPTRVTPRSKRLR